MAGAYKRTTRETLKLNNETPTWCLIDRLGNVVSVDIGADDSIVLIVDDKLSPLSKKEVVQLIRALKNAMKWIRKNDSLLAKYVM